MGKLFGLAAVLAACIGLGWAQPALAQVGGGGTDGGGEVVYPERIWRAGPNYSQVFTLGGDTVWDMGLLVQFDGRPSINYTFELWVDEVGLGFEDDYVLMAQDNVQAVLREAPLTGAGGQADLHCDSISTGLWPATGTNPLSYNVWVGMYQGATLKDSRTLTLGVTDNR